MHIDWWTFALETGNFLILVVLLHHFLYKPVLAVIARRRDDVEQTFQDAEEARRAAEHLMAGFQDEKAELARQREERMAEERRAMDSERKRILDEARAQGEELMAAMRRQLADEREEAGAELNRCAAEVAVALARALLADAGIELDAGQLTETLFDRACKILEAMPSRELFRLARLRGAPGAVRVVSARPLGDADQERWRARLRRILRVPGDVTDVPLAVEFAGDPALVEGVELHLDGAVVRCHWGETLRAATQEMTSRDKAA